MPPPRGLCRVLAHQPPFGQLGAILLGLINCFFFGVGTILDGLFNGCALPTIIIGILQLVLPFVGECSDTVVAVACAVPPLGCDAVEGVTNEVCMQAGFGASSGQSSSSRWHAAVAVDAESATPAWCVYPRGGLLSASWLTDELPACVCVLYARACAVQGSRPRARWWTWQQRPWPWSRPWPRSSQGEGRSLNPYDSRGVQCRASVLFFLCLLCQCVVNPCSFATVHASRGHITCLCELRCVLC